MTTSRPNPRRPRGTFLIEVLGYLVIMAAVTLLVVDIINILMSVTKEATQRDTTIQRLDSALLDLRRDAWNAAALTTTDNSATFTLPTGTVTWQMNPDATLTRTAPDATRRTWTQMPPFHFAAASPLLRVTLDSAPNQHEQITLPSQRLLAGGDK